MTRSRLLASLALATALAVPSSAAAQTALFTEDAEGDPTAKWVVGTPPEGVEPWQKSDSGAQKFRGNETHGGSSSFWSGTTPENWPLVPTTVPAGANVVEGESILTMKTPILVPADGKTTLEYWSLFQNEGDDQGLAQVAFADGGTVSAWKNVKVEQATQTSAGSNDPRACDISRPDYTNSIPFEKQSVALDNYKGRMVLIRFNLKYGAENRPVSQPCGWYLDDIAVTTTGTPGAAPAAGDTPAPVTAPSVDFGTLRLKGKKGRLGLTVSGGDLTAVKLTVLKGRRKVATGVAKKLPAGERIVKLKFRKKPKKGTYVVRFSGRAADGSAVTGSSKVRAR